MTAPYRTNKKADAGLDGPGDIYANAVPPCAAHDAASTAELDQQALQVQKAIRDLIKLAGQEVTEDRVVKIAEALF